MSSNGTAHDVTQRSQPSFADMSSAQRSASMDNVVRQVETLTRVTANADGGAFIFVYNGATLLGGGLAAGVLILNFAVVAPQNLRIVVALAGPGSRVGDLILSWV